MILGPLQLDRPQWLLLAPVLWLLAWWMARRSLGGLGSVTRHVALGVRLAVILLLCFALAEPRWRDISEDVAVVAVADTSGSMPPGAADAFAAYLAAAAGATEPDDRLGYVTTGEAALVQAIPSKAVREVRVDTPSGSEGTDLAAAVRLALAILPEDAAGRIVLNTDGNETKGSLLAAAEAARAVGVPIDVLPTMYAHDREITLERFIAPQTARRGEPANLRFVMRATRPTKARLTLLAGDEPIDLDPSTPGDSAIVDLEEGVNVQSVPISLSTQGVKRFRATLEPLDAADDTIAENNLAAAVSIVGGEGRVLVLAEDLTVAAPLLEALAEAQIEAAARPASEGWPSLVDLGEFDAVVLADVSAYSSSAQQQEELKSYIHDLGGGLVVVGGPNSFGAGGWIGSPLADALPVKLDPPQKRHMPKGALALVMHSCEVPNGNFWGMKTALAAAETLSRLDLIGVVELSWQQMGPFWVHPLQPVGDKTRVRAAINSLSFGDLKDFGPILQQVYDQLSKAAAGQKHVIIISDGDPAMPSDALIRNFIAAKITISAVAVFPHSFGAGIGTAGGMRELADRTGGKFYFINDEKSLPQLPQIFIKEAQTVKRSLIWEGDPFAPTIVDSSAEPLRGIRGLPRIRGYVVTAEREGLALVTASGPENDPILAQWQHGLGRVVAFVSDATARWTPEWLSWDNYRTFWEQHVRWAMRPTGSATTRVVTETRGDATTVVVEAVLPSGEPMNFARFQGAVVKPDLTAEPVELRQTGAGRYEGSFRSDAAGSYVLSLRYESADAMGKVDRGSTQAAVVKPFADERRALADNAALLRQVAELTGGRVLDPSPERAEVFSRDGLTMPVATQSIWLLVACVAVGLFLADVAVRRVRIDVRAMARALRKAASRSKAQETQVDALRQAREKARGVIAKRTAEEPRQAPGGEIPAQPSDAAGVKFEAAPETLRRKPASPVDAAAPAAPPDPDSAKPKPAAAKDDEEGISRLMKAKRRARESMKDDDSPAGPPRA